MLGQQTAFVKKNYSKINSLQRRFCLPQENVSYDTTGEPRHMWSARRRQYWGKGAVTEGSRQKHDASCRERGKKLDSPRVAHVLYPIQVCARSMGAAGALKGQR